MKNGQINKGEWKENVASRDIGAEKKVNRKKKGGKH